MNLPRISVQRPIFTTMVTLIVVIMGFFPLMRLKIDLLPNIELPTITIRTLYEGASPEVMEKLVTEIIEEIVGTVPGVEELTSQSSEGNSSVRVTFSWGTDINTAALDVQAKLEDEINELPDDIVRPRVSKFDIAGFPVVILGISSNLDPVELTQLVENQVRYRFGRLTGVAQVDLFGGFDREVRVELDPDRVKALGLPIDQILESLRNANIDLPAGKIKQGRYEVTLRAPSEFTDLDQIRNTVIYHREGAAVTLGEVAQVRETYEKLRRITRVDGERGLRVAIRKQADANTVEVAKAVLAEIEDVNRAFPQIRIVPVINQGNFIERSIANVAQSVLYGGGLSVLVLLFFLRNIRSTFVISLSIPLSVIATFSLIYFGGFTLNLMTLGGLALGVGMMVDSSVVVLENIFRRRNENKEHPQIAAVEGAREVGPAIVASTITTLVIFLPLVFVRGVSGILFQELSYVMRQAACHHSKIWGIIILVIGVSVGCTPVDRWAIFNQVRPDSSSLNRLEPVVKPVEIQMDESEISPADIQTEDVLDLSVEKAVLLALRHNRDLHVRQISPVITGAFEQIERGRYDPEFFAQADYFKESAAENAEIGIDSDNDVSKESSIITGLRQELPTGTLVEAGIGQSRTISSRNTEEQEARLGLSVTQSLLQGFGSAVNLASIRQAEIDTLASVFELRGFAESLLADTEIAYWRYVLAKEEIAIFLQSLAVAKKQREEIEVSIEVGILPEFEVAAARAEEAFRIQALINARSQVEDSRLRLLRLISPSPDGYLDSEIQTISEPRIEPQQIIDLNDRLQLAEQSRADLKEAHLRLQQNRLETIVTRNGLLPRLELFITLGKLGYSDTFTDSFREIDGDSYDLSAGIRLNHFLGNRAGKARNLAAYATQQQAREAIANLRLIIHLDVRLAINEAERLRQQIDASRAARIFQEQTMNAEKERFEVGAGTALQVAQAQRDLVFTQIAEVEAIVNYRIALVQLYLAEGSLLERRGIGVNL